MQTLIRPPYRVALVLLPALLLALPAGGRAATCGSTENTYQFVNLCAYPVWLAERSTADATSYPPQSGNWALSGLCTDNAACPSGVCDANSGRCTCTTSSDCPGGAVCEGDGKCGLAATVCVPQAWSSGTFWARTGCTLDDTVTPATLTCDTGSCFPTAGGTPLLDCSVANGGGSPNNPVTQFEVTSSTSSVNYDVSIAAGYNVELKAVPRGGGQVLPATPATDVVGCYDVGCTSDLNATCPAPLQVTSDGQVIGCLDPCTRCQRSDPPSTLACSATLGPDWTDCSAGSGATTYQDLYCAKNFSDGNPQASPNQGTPTAFSQADCAPLTTFVVPTFASSYALPAGAGFCMFTSEPQSTSGLNDFSWADQGTATTRNCSALVDGTPCGGYRAKQSDGSYYADALGYTCQTATFPLTGGGMQTAHVCAPPTAGGLGVCTKDGAGGLPLYSSAAGVTNPDWITASTAAGGGTTPYYETFKAACPSAYAWQYDDAASGFACSVGSAPPGGSTFTGFDVTFCRSTVQPQAGGMPEHFAGMRARGNARALGRPRRGRLLVRGFTTLPTDMALTELTVAVTDLLDEVGAGGELVGTGSAALPLALAPKRRRAKRAIFASEPGVEPRVRVVLVRRKPASEDVKVIVTARRASIARPAACAASKTVLLETGLDLGAGGEVTRVGSIAEWRCQKKALRRG